MFLVKFHKLSVVTQGFSKTVSLHKDYLSHIKCETISAFCPEAIKVSKRPLSPPTTLSVGRNFPSWALRHQQGSDVRENLTKHEASTSLNRNKQKTALKDLESKIIGPHGGYGDLTQGGRISKGRPALQPEVCKHVYAGCLSFEEISEVCLELLGELTSR